MNKRSIFVLILTTFFILSFALPAFAQDDAPRMGLWETCPTPENLPTEVPLGLNMGLTGATSIYGIPQQQGIDLAIAEINAAGYLGDAVLVPYLEDGGSSPEEAISAMEKLINEDQVVAVIGPTFSTQAFAADPIAQEAGIPVMGITNLANGITDMGEYIFRNGLLDNQQIPAAVDAVVELLAVESAGILYSDNDEFTVTGFDVFLEAADANNIDIVAEETFQTGDVDFNAQITNIIASNPDAIFVAALGAEAIPLLTQIRSLGYTGPIVGNNGLNTPALLTEIPDDAQGVILGAAWHVSSDNPLNVDFVTAFEAEYGFLPDQFSAQAYSAAWTMATAIRCGNSAEPSDIRDALDAIENLPTPLGDFSFDENRDPVHEATVQIIVDGEFEILTPETVASVYDN